MLMGRNIYSVIHFLSGLYRNVPLVWKDFAFVAYFCVISTLIQNVTMEGVSF